MTRRRSIRYEVFRGRLDSPAWRTHMCGEPTERTTYRWEPPTNVYETETGGLVHIEVAGMRDEDFRISLSEGVLRVSGERSLKAAPSVIALHRMEIATGRFSSEVRVPWEVDPTGVRVEYRDGLLSIALPRRGASE